MNAVVVEQIGSFEYLDLPVPEPAGGEVLIHVDVTGLCRTDLKIIAVGHRDLVLPRIPGEEVVGRISALGPGVEGFQEGDLVYVYPGTSCGTCPQCRAGAGNLCREMRIMGFHRDGGFAEYVTAPEKSLIRVPAGLTPDQAVFAEPLSCCLNALELAGLRSGERIGIWGAGPAGLLLSRAARAQGAEPCVIEPDPRRRAFAEGRESPPAEPLDAAVVAVGDGAAYAEALASLGPRGRLVFFSGLPKEASTLTVDVNRMHYLEQSVVGAYGCSFRHGVGALDLLADGSVVVEDMISHRLPLDELEHALDLVRTRGGIKILLYPGEQKKRR